MILLASAASQRCAARPVRAARAAPRSIPRRREEPRVPPISQRRRARPRTCDVISYSPSFRYDRDAPLTVVGLVPALLVDVLRPTGRMIELSYPNYPRKAPILQASAGRQGPWWRDRIRSHRQRCNGHLRSGIVGGPRHEYSTIFVDRMRPGRRNDQRSLNVGSITIKASAPEVTKQETVPRANRVGLGALLADVCLDGSQLHGPADDHAGQGSDPRRRLRSSRISPFRLDPLRRSA